MFIRPKEKKCSFPIFVTFFFPFLLNTATSWHSVVLRITQLMLAHVSTTQNEGKLLDTPGVRGLGAPSHSWWTPH